MTGVVEVPLWLIALLALAAAVAILDRVLAPSLRWVLRRRLMRAVDDLNERLHLRIQPFALMRRQSLVDRLTYDSEVMAAAEAHAAETGMPQDIVVRQVREYAREIAPSFSATMYFGVGARICRWIARLLYRVRLGAFDRDGLAAVGPEASIVFAMNHRSNVDYLLVTHLASESSTLSYAVGEWAQVWPLSRIIRSMGAYFVRRRSRDALYRAVLRRYVQMATKGGVTQAMFPEGGLSRDGALAPPKLGILSYILDDFDPEGPRDVVFVPVGLNYDRVLEDRLLLAAGGEAGGAGRFRVSFWAGLRFALVYLFGRLTGRAHRFGYACVSFGAPLSLRAFLAEEGAAKDGDAPVERLGAVLAERIGAVVPVLPVSLIAAVLMDADGPMTRPELEAAAIDRAERLAAAGAHLHIPRADLAYGVEAGLRMLTLRRIVAETAGGYVADPGEGEILRFYANAIRHLSPSPSPSPGASAEDQASS